ncbi:hypothetical protein [Pectinatus haikarae]|uniref:Uncharacterized protein n=1 Tax=Pectinatus haikarae TaxID=349096 RepID=A0ABT9Y5T0_9FIRM|nr:hypothetical protein [Pectinatus haikarae]MDQ0202499.1 hypothetical protein [Pectinatus haikarae]
MKNKETENKYWENEKGEMIEFGNYFMRCYDQVGKVQFGVKYFNPKTGEKKYATKFVLDRKELCESKEGLPYLRETLNEWKEWADNND